MIFFVREKFGVANLIGNRIQAFSSLHVKYDWENKSWFEIRQSFNIIHATAKHNLTNKEIIFVKLLIRKDVRHSNSYVRSFGYKLKIGMLLLFPFLVHPVSCYFWEFTSTSKHQVDYGVDVTEELDSNKTLRKKGFFQRIHCQTLQYLRSSESFYSRLIEKVKNKQHGGHIL